jgi:hypothetical protein
MMLVAVITAPDALASRRTESSQIAYDESEELCGPIDRKLVGQVEEVAVAGDEECICG